MSSRLGRHTHDFVMQAARVLHRCCWLHAAVGEGTVRVELGWVGWDGKREGQDTGPRLPLRRRLHQEAGCISWCLIGTEGRAKGLKHSISLLQDFGGERHLIPSVPTKHPRENLGNFLRLTADG